MSEDERADAYIDKKKNYMYDELIRDTNSVFHNYSKTDVFVTAATIGYYRKSKQPIPGSDKQSLFVSTTLGSKSEDKIWILKSIAMCEGGIQVLKSMKEVIRICQEFANVGIIPLYEIHKTSDNEVRDLAKLMSEALDCYVE